MRGLVPRLWRPFCALIATLAAVCIAACDSGDQEGAAASTTPGGGQVVTEGAPLHEARLDAAKRAKADAADVSLRSLRSAGFDGCLGVTDPGEACTQPFIGGYIAIYDGSGAEYRYHFGNGRYVWADPAKQVSEGSPVPAEIAPNLNRELAAYAREDLELRVKDDGARVIAILPTTFPSGCMGFLPDGQDACDTVIVEGAIVFLLGPDGKTYRYHVGMKGAIATDFVKGRITSEPLATVRVSQQLMRDDLARRLGVATTEVEVASYRLVTWPDGCVGVYRRDALCAQALVEGFLAFIRGPDGKEYRYHGGAQGTFIAASFEPTARIAEPLLAR